MRTLITVIAIVLLLGLGYVGYAHFSGGSIPTLGLPIGGERAKIRARTLAFFEHVKFKNASAFKDFVSPDVTAAEVSQYLVKTIGENIDTIDLVKVAIVSVELDTQETRARARVELEGIDLVDKTAFSVSKVIFLYRARDGEWYIDTKTLSL